MVEVDQKASGLMILVLLLGLESMAEVTNVLSKKPQDIYLYVMSQIEGYFENATYKKKNSKKEVNFDKKRTLDLLKTSRSLNKGMLMRWSYGEGAQSRGKGLVEAFNESNIEECNDEEFATLHAFARQYDMFLDKLFPGLEERKNLLLQALRIRAVACKKSDTLNAVNITTLDGCALSWDYTPTESATFGYFNPVFGKHTTYKVNIASESEEAEEARVKDLQRAFYPNFIHSIDAAIMRIIIKKMYEKTGYRIGHIHDCIMVHPNYVEDLFVVIQEIYTGKDLKNLADRLFFEPMKEGLASDIKRKIKEIQTEFNKKKDKIKVDKKTFTPRNAYGIEGSVSELDIWFEENHE
jgi:DNA-directed RNA polymerase